MEEATISNKRRKRKRERETQRERDRERGKESMFDFYAVTDILDSWQEYIQYFY